MLVLGALGPDCCEGNRISDSDTAIYADSEIPVGRAFVPSEKVENPRK